MGRKEYEEAKRFFNLQEGYVLHHKDMSLRHTNPERYNEWRPEDLIVMSKHDHMSYHRQFYNPMEGKHHSEETKEKMSKAKLGVPKSEEHKKALSESHKGYVPTKESSIKKSIAMKKIWAERKQLCAN